MFFTKVVGLLCHAGWGVPMYNWKKKKLKKDYVQLEKIKTKKIEKKAMYN